MVTNGVLHARTPLEVGLTSDDRGLLVEVHDSDPRPPTTRGHRINLLADIDEVLLRPDASAVHDERQALRVRGRRRDQRRLLLHVPVERRARHPKRVADLLHRVALVCVESLIRAH